MPKINYGVPTMVDIANANLFADAQVDRARCQDPEVISGVCSYGNAGGGNCISWVEDKTNQKYPTPSNYFRRECATDSDCIAQNGMGICVNQKCQCATDSDCKYGMTCRNEPETDPTNPEKVCAFVVDDPATGHCIFNSEKACVAYGELPYTCDSRGYCKNKDPPANPTESKAYTEWHVNPETNKGECVLGNFVLRQWCENPGSRCQQDQDGNYPSECSGSSTKGVTNVPPFIYNPRTGQCNMSRDYCDTYDLHYNRGGCNTDSDCREKGGYCSTMRNGDKYCTGPLADCYETTGEAVGKFIIGGETLFHMFKNWGQTGNLKYFDPKNCAVEGYKVGDERDDNYFEQFRNIIKECFSTLPDDAIVEYDEEKDVFAKKVLQENFAGEGIHMYMIGKYSGIEVGFSGEEVEKVYPKNVSRKGGVVTIKVNKNEIGDDWKLKRLYMGINSRMWLTENIDKMINMFIERKNGDKS